MALRFLLSDLGSFHSLTVLNYCNIRIDKPWQTVQTQIKLLEESTLFAILSALFDTFLFVLILQQTFSVFKKSGLL